VTWALVAKELRLAARARAIRVVLIGYLLGFLTACLVLLAGFLAADDSVAGDANALLFSRFSGLQWALLAGLTPWLVLEHFARDLGNGGAPPAGCMLVRPWQVLAAKAVVSAACLTVLLSLSLPVFTLAQLMGVASLRQIAWSIADGFLLLLLLALLVFHIRLQCRIWALSWVASYVMLGIVAFGWNIVSSSLAPRSGTMILALLAALVGALLPASGNRALMYERN